MQHIILTVKTTLPNTKWFGLGFICNVGVNLNSYMKLLELYPLPSYRDVWNISIFLFNKAKLFLLIFLFKGLTTERGL